MNDADTIDQFFRDYRAIPVGVTPPRPEAAPPEDEEAVAALILDAERALADWAPIPLSEAPAKSGEYPVRFIDGSHAGQPALCVRSPQGYPIPLLVAEVGAVTLKLEGRRFIRAFVAVERVLGFVADPFRWADVEAFATAVINLPDLQLRVLPARMPNANEHSSFDYEVMRGRAHNRCQNEMLKLEVLAMSVEPNVPTLVDGQLGGRIGERAADARELLVGVVKSPTPAALHDRGWNTLLDLRPGQRTPYFHDTRVSQSGERKGTPTDVPLASWYLRLAGGPRLAPNWGIVRVDVPWVQLERKPESDRSGFINRLSRWLIDARCRTESYARMPVSLDPIVRAEEALKPLFTPLPVLVNRLYRRAGLFQRDEL